jgi:hypothetical protein
MAVSVQDWIWEELDGDRAQGPQLVTDRRKTVQLHSGSTSDEEAPEDEVPVRRRNTNIGKPDGGRSQNQ